MGAEGMRMSRRSRECRTDGACGPGCAGQGRHSREDWWAMWAVPEGSEIWGRLVHRTPRAGLTRWSTGLQLCWAR